MNKIKQKIPVFVLLTIFLTGLVLWWWIRKNNTVDNNPTSATKAQTETNISTSQQTKENKIEITIGGKTIPLFFVNTEISQEVKQSISGDIELILSYTDHVEWNETLKPKQWHDILISHKLQGWERKELPEVIKQNLGAGVTVNNVPHLIISNELIDAYIKALDLKDQHPRMFAEIKDFLALFGDSKKLKNLSRDREAATNMVYCYQTSTEHGLKVLREYASLSIVAKCPSLLDIKPLHEVTQDNTADKNVFVMSTIFSWKKNDDDREHQEYLPIGVYADDKWHIFSFSMP